MADTLANILGGRFDEPPEVRIIKDFVREHYKQSVAVTVKPSQIIIEVRGAALAGALRARLHELQGLANTKKRLVLRIS